MKLPDVSEIWLRIAAKEGACSFSYALPGGEWMSLEEKADATLLTTQVAGGFVGATVGMHARLEK